MIRSVVDLPVPEPPMMPTASPLLTLIFAPRSIGLLPKDLCTFRNSMRTSLAADSVLEDADVLACWLCAAGGSAAGNADLSDVLSPYKEGRSS